MPDTLGSLDGSAVSLATIIRALADERERVSSQAELDTVAPAEGRVAELTTDGSLFVGDGSQWLSESEVGAALSSVQLTEYATADDAPSSHGPGLVGVTADGNLLMEDGN